MVGLSSMVGAGIFVAFAPAALAAGSWLLVGLGLAALVAGANAASTAQLAAVYPRAGGAYVYGREQLGPWWGFMAGWSFIVGKTASCAAIALVFASYVAPDGWEKPFAVIVVVAATVLNLLGVNRTAQTAAVIVTLVIGVLIGVIIISASTPAAAPMPSESKFDLYGVFQSASVLFFAFAGYARIATLGEEVVEPARSIPRAMAISLTATVLLYCAIGLVALRSLGAQQLGITTTPLADIVGSSGIPAAPWIVMGAAALASVGALVSLQAGVGRTTFALARNRDLPHALSALGARFAVPYRADILIAIFVIATIIFADLRTAIGLSSFGVLLYYFVANVSSLTLAPQQRSVSRAVSVFGALLCLLLAATVPLTGIALGVLVVALGIPVRLLSNRQSSTVSHHAA